MSTVPKRFWILLVTSVALNLFLLGLMAGRLVHLRPRFERDEIDTRAFLRQSGLRSAGPEVKAILRQRHGQVRERMHALGQARDHVRRSLEAEPYDPAEVTRALQQTRDLTTQMQADMHEVLVDVAGKLDPDQRKRMAESLWSGRRRH